MRSYPYAILVYGPAGSGKTTLTAKFEEWLKENTHYRVASVNLDAGSVNLPYRPVFNVRDFIRIEKLMKERNLGPNGALMLSVEEETKLIPTIIERVNGLDYVLIDTPGIMEVFTGREAGRKIVEQLSRKLTVVGVFVMDASAIRTASELIYFKTLCVLGSLKLGLITIPIWNKIDIATPEFKGLIALEKDKLADKLLEEGGLYTEAATGMAEITSKLEQAVRIIKIDSLSGRGLDELYEAIHETFCVCGDLT